MPSPSEELQQAIYNALVADDAVGEIIGDRIHDGRPTTYPCVTFGPSDGQEDDAECITGNVETIQLDCWVRDRGQLRPAKALVYAVKRALHRAELSLNAHALVFITVPYTRVMLDPDGVTGHGIVSVEAHIEETV